MSERPVDAEFSVVVVDPPVFFVVLPPLEIAAAVPSVDPATSLDPAASLAVPSSLEPVAAPSAESGVSPEVPPPLEPAAAPLVEVGVAPAVPVPPEPLEAFVADGETEDDDFDGLGHTFSYTYCSGAPVQVFADPASNLPLGYIQQEPEEYGVFIELCGLKMA